MAGTPGHPPGQWIVPVAGLLRARGDRQAESRCGRLEELRVAESVVAAGAEIKVDVLLDSVEGAVEVSGTVVAPWRGECRRCLAPICGVLSCDVRELYRRRSGGAADESDETYPLGSESLDLEPLVRDALLLELPRAPLCQPGCLGLCQTCGADLNGGPCGCPAPTGDPRWAALDVLRELGSG